MKQLYKYQEEYLSNLPKNCIMAADTGLGKTLMAMEHARRHGATQLIVIAPASKVRTGDWEREVAEYLGPSVPVKVVSYEMFSKQWLTYMNPNFTLIVDESHMACNATTKRAKAIIKVATQARQWIMLSATPLPNGWRSGETYAVLTGLSRNKTDFVNRFVIIDRSRGFPLIMGYREQSVLKNWWSAIAKPLKREGSLVLPSQNIPLSAVMSAKTSRTYKTAVQKRIYEDELLDNPSKLFTTLRQIPLEARLEALEGVIEGTDEHVIVFYNFNSERDAMLELLAKSFKQRKVYEQSGHASTLPPREKWATMKPSVTLVQYQSGSMAIELQYASITVYLSPCTSFANYEQSRGRNLRNGQDKIVLFYHLAVKGSIDEHIWGLLKKKKTFSKQIVEQVIHSAEKSLA